jgi:hypothetical protein
MQPLKWVKLSILVWRWFELSPKDLCDGSLVPVWQCLGGGCSSRMWLCCWGSTLRLIKVSWDWISSHKNGLLEEAGYFPLHPSSACNTHMCSHHCDNIRHEVLTRAEQMSAPCTWTSRTVSYINIFSL